ncbi:hypothetical protein CNMCM8980_008095 [Aspergillus fumigatiaffinis]|uniref:Uncharacterized protein n=1 Tax=Aspergillus fumigatiaffinis TaxID=340414 RepID=A0A8H4H3Z8_9EURO|nr:hypothetical protein CNMCM5878_007871 [Aspergillus fumigatiaffinis]KAF4225444.1 hypothetical protein CNMCM6457_008181 [Aspergillus fumigatiaffinis]KAF4235442.1 hypothetical protein CNMCM6805_008145 [Aspergillus fumigatiaffinis]KAF4246820.1 hypothetical protein CNMCM8980_008095 [Aspergillus fumigatiaffinis]
MSAELTKVDSAIAGLSISPKDEKAPDKAEKKTHKRTTSQSEGVWNIKDLAMSFCSKLILSSVEAQKIELSLPIETQKTGWKLNTSPNTIEDKDVLKMYLVTPPVKKIDLVWPLGLSVTARNLKGVTADDELDKPYLAGFEWDKEECWTRLIVHQTKNGPPAAPSKKSKKKKDEA